MQVAPLPGRECGDCHVCCHVLTVDSPEFQKHGGERCRHALAGNVCGIYPDRYPVCRSFECGWRIFRWVRPGLRPDLSHVLIQARAGEDGAPPEGIVLYLLEEAALDAEGLAETVAAVVSAGHSVVVGVPGAAGHSAGYQDATGPLADAVRARDKGWVIDVLREARERCLAVPREPVVLAHGQGADPPPSRP